MKSSAAITSFTVSYNNAVAAVHTHHGLNNAIRPSVALHPCFDFIPCCNKAQHQSAMSRSLSNTSSLVRISISASCLRHKNQHPPDLHRGLSPHSVWDMDTHPIPPLSTPALRGLNECPPNRWENSTAYTAPWGPTMSRTWGLEPCTLDLALLIEASGSVPT